MTRPGRSLDDLHAFARAYRRNAASASPMADTVAEFGIDRATGKRWAADCRKYGMLPPVAERPQLPVAWQPAVAGFTEWLGKSNRSPATVETCLRHLEWLAEGVDVGPWDLRMPELAEWLDGHRWSRETRRKVLVSLRCFYAWATSQAYLQWAPTAGLPSAEQRSGPMRLVFPSAWAGPVGEYLTWCQAAAHARGTLDMRRWWLGRLSEVSSDPWSVTTQQLATFLAMPDHGAQHKRAGRSSIRSFYGWAVKAGHIRESPALALEVVRVPRALPRPAPAEVVREALAAADPRVRLAIMLGAYAGLRRAEIASVHASNISDSEILVIGKGGHERRVPLHPDLRAEIIGYRARQARETSRVTGWLFPSTQRHDGPISAGYLGKLIGRALPGVYTAHTLRHRFATAAYLSQRDLRAVQELLGHMKPETTARYAAVPEGALRSAVAGVGL